MASGPAHDELDMTLSDALEHWVAKHPDKRLWTYLDHAGRETSNSVTYRELEDRTRTLGLSLLSGAKGRTPLSVGDRVLLVFPPSLNFVLAFVACLRAGLVAVPVYPPDPRKLRKDIQAFSRTAASCGATVALTSSVYDHAKKASAIKAKLTGDDSRWPNGLQWVVTDKPLPQSAAATAAQTRSGINSAAVSDETTATGRGRIGGAGLDRSSLAFLQYTSGSTGDPKGVKITHGNLAHNLGAIVRELEAGEGTVVVSWLPQYHDMGLIGSLLGTLYCGGSGYYLSPIDFVRMPTVWMEAVGRFRATHLQAPNFGFALCARKWKALRTPPEVDLSSVVHMINAAEPIDAGSIDIFEDIFRPYGLREGVIKPTYGLAEHTVFVCSGGEQRLTVDRRALEVDKEVKLFSGDTEAPTSKDHPLSDDATTSASTPSSSYSSAWCKLVGCGFPSRVRGLELLVVDPSNDRPLAEGRVGEVWIRSPSKAHGYWGLPERSREAFCAVPSSDENATSMETSSRDVEDADPVGSRTPPSQGAKETVAGVGVGDEVRIGVDGEESKSVSDGGEVAPPSSPPSLPPPTPSSSAGGDAVASMASAASAGAAVSAELPAPAIASSAEGGQESTSVDDALTATAATPAAAGGGGESNVVAADNRSAREGREDSPTGDSADVAPPADADVAAELHSAAEASAAAGRGGSGGGGGVSEYSAGFLRTGDEGFMYGGELFICGRIKDLVIVAGRNHYPQDIERTAERGRNESIRPGCSAAFSVPGGGDRGGELLVLTVELRESQVKVSGEKRRQLAEEIRRSVVNEHGVELPHLLLLAPRSNIKTTSGKIARQWCRRAFLDDQMKPLLHLETNTRNDHSTGDKDDSGAGSGGVLPNVPQTVSEKGPGGHEAGNPGSQSPATGSPTDVSRLTDEDILKRLQGALASIVGDGSSPATEVPFYTLGLSSMAAAQFSGLLEQEYGVHVPLSTLDSDGTTLRSLVPLMKAGATSESNGASAPGGQGVVTGIVAPVASSETMARETPGRCEETITNSCPCCLCLLSCPCCG